MYHASAQGVDERMIDVHYYYYYYYNKATILTALFQDVTDCTSPAEVFLLSAAVFVDVQP